MEAKQKIRTTRDGARFFNAVLLDDDGSEMSSRLFLRDAKTKKTNEKRLAEVRGMIADGYRFPLLRERLAKGA